MISSIWLHNLVSYSLQIFLMVMAGTILIGLFRPRISGATLAYWQILLLACLILPLCQPWRASGNPSSGATGAILFSAQPARPSGEAPPVAPRSRTWPIQELVLLGVAGGIMGRSLW